MDSKQFEQRIAVVGQRILIACLRSTTTFPEALLSGKIRKTLDFKTTDSLYFSLLGVQKIIDANHDRECLRLRKLIQRHLDKAFDFDKEVKS